MRHDRYGLEITTASDEAAQAYREGVDLMLAARAGADAAFARAIAADEGFALAHLAATRVAQMQGRMAEARAAVAAAQRHEAGCTARERGQIAILARILAGEAPAALAAVLEHLAEHPRDALVLSLPLGAFGLFAFSGRADHDRARVALCRRVAAHYGEDWWFTGYLGWSCTEAGVLDEGLALTERALALNPANANAAHALAHARFERGETEAGRSLLETFLPQYERGGILNAHLCWHLALLALEQDDVARALALYENRIRPDVSSAPPLNSLTDAASLLWRIALRDDAPATLPWDEAAQYGAAHFATAGLAFADVHMAMLAAMTGSADALAARIAALDALVAAGRLPAGSVVPGLCRGIAAFAAGAYDEAADRLLPLLPEVMRIGGSGAQRDMIEDTAIAACLKAGRATTARALLRRRFADS